MGRTLRKRNKPKVMYESSGLSREVIVSGFEAANGEIGPMLSWIKQRVGVLTRSDERQIAEYVQQQVKIGDPRVRFESEWFRYS